MKNLTTTLRKGLFFFFAALLAFQVSYSTDCFAQDDRQGQATQARDFALAGAVVAQDNVENHFENMKNEVENIRAAKAKLAKLQWEKALAKTTQEIGDINWKQQQVNVELSSAQRRLVKQGELAARQTGQAIASTVSAAGNSIAQTATESFGGVAGLFTGSGVPTEFTD